MILREDVPARVSALMDERVVRWLPRERPVGDYEGRERTLEVFTADVADQLELLGRLEPLRAEIEAGVGGPIVVLFHTSRETARLFPELATAFVRRALP